MMRDWCIANQESIKNLFKKHHVSISELQENIFKEENSTYSLKKSFTTVRKKFVGKEENVI